MESKNLCTVTEKAEKIYRKEKAKGLTNAEIERKFFIFYHIAVKMGNPFIGTTPNLTIEQMLALYSMQTVLHKVYSIALANK